MTISNSDKVIDSRDIIARIEELESDQEDLESNIQDAQDALEELDEEATEEERESAQEAIEAAQQALADWDDAEELKTLQALHDEASGYCPDWRHGASLIRDSYFEEYAQQLAEDIGAIDPKANWPLSHIDWEAAAEELKSDYTSVDFDGVEYWIR